MDGVELTPHSTHTTNNKMAANKNYKNPTAFITYTKALKKTGQFFLHASR